MDLNNLQRLDVHEFIARPQQEKINILEALGQHKRNLSKNVRIYKLYDYWIGTVRNENSFAFHYVLYDGHEIEIQALSMPDL